MSQHRHDTDETLARLWAYAAYAEAHPLSPAEVDTWLHGLGGLNDFDGKIDQLAACEEMLEHAEADDMLDADRVTVTHAILRLHKELDAIPDHLRVRARVDYLRRVAMLNPGEADDPLSD